MMDRRLKRTRPGADQSRDRAPPVAGGLSSPPLPIVNHDEAWSLACMKRETSNLARCYIEAMDLLREWCDPSYDHHAGLADVRRKAKSVINQVGASECPTPSATYMKRFDLHSPFDAPLRAQKAREETEREKSQLYLESPEGQKVLSDICKKAMRRIKRRGRSASGGPDGRRN